MICFNGKTSFSFAESTASLKKLIDKMQYTAFDAIAIADTSAYSHAGILEYYSTHAICGYSFFVSTEKKQRRCNCELSVYPLSHCGLIEIRKLIYECGKNFYYNERLPRAELTKYLQNKDLIFVGYYPFCEELNITDLKNVYFEASVREKLFLGDINKYVYCQHMNYLDRQDAYVYELHSAGNIGRGTQKNTTPQHFLTKLEIQDYWKKYGISDDIISSIENNTAKVSLNFEHFTQNKIHTIPIAYGKIYDELSVSKYQLKDRVAIYKYMEGKIAKLLPNLTANESKVYYDRAVREVDVLCDKGFFTYMILVADIVAYAKTIMLVGAGRGSACGSLVAFLMGITSIDSVKHDLLFERFLSPERADMPDIDIDVNDKQRHLIFEYLQKKYGEKSVFKLGTINYYKNRACLDNFSKLAFLTENETKTLEKLKFKSDIMPLKQCIDELSHEKNIPNIQYALKLLGVPSHSGVHAGAVVIVQDDIFNYVAVDGKGDNICITKEQCEQIGILKIDVLGLLTLNIIEKTLELANISKKEFLKSVKNCDDIEVYRQIGHGNLYGAFQFDKPTASAVLSSVYDLCCKNGIDFNLDMLAICNALARPSGKGEGGGVAQLLHALKYGQRITGVNEFDEITQKTYGVIVFQEQIMEIVRILGGFSFAEASEIRKIIAKSKGNSAIDEYKNKFICGGEKQGHTPDFLIQVWQIINASSSYAFNKSHSYAYSTMSYWTLYLKRYYPIQFTCALLNKEQNNNANNTSQAMSKVDKAIIINNAIKYHAIEIELLATDKMGLEWQIKDNKIVSSITEIKNVGSTTAKSLLQRKEKGKLTQRDTALLQRKIEIDCPFHNFNDYYENTAKYGISVPLQQDWDIMSNGIYASIVYIASKKLKFINDEEKIKKRNGKIVDVSDLIHKGYYPTFSVFNGYKFNTVYVDFNDINNSLWDFYHENNLKLWALIKFEKKKNALYKLIKYKMLSC